MLTDALKTEIRLYYALVASSLPGFVPRAGQREMIGCIANAMAHCRTDSYLPEQGENIAVVEGRTGVGKTVGYLVPGLVMAHTLNKKLVVSSATVALQEQLTHRDIPALLDLFPNKDAMGIVLAKGRGRYVCPAKLKTVSGNGGKDDFFGGAAWERPPRADELGTLATLLESLDRKNWCGDRDELGFAVPDELWIRGTNDANGCTGRNCPEYSSCPFFAARKRMQGAKIIVVNHDLVLSSLANDSKSFPSAAECLWIFDEAHHLVDIAVRRAAASHFLAGAVTWIEKMPATCAKACALLALPRLADTINEAAQVLGHMLNTVSAALNRFDGFKEERVFRFEHGVLDPAFLSIAEKLKSSASSLTKNLEDVLSAINTAWEEGTHDTEELAKLQLGLGSLYAKAQNLAEVWSRMCENSGEEPLAKWVEHKGNDFQVCVCPLKAAGQLTRLLWDKVGSAVLTSATLTTLGRFDFLLARTGLDGFPATLTTSVRSPFNYAEQGTIVIPPMKTDPKNAEAHTAEVASLIPVILQGYFGNLALFASRRQMEAVYHAQPDHVRSTILMQGALPKRQIIESHVSLIESGKQSTIFGLASFGEGIDLPGALCQQVIIAKIPFPPPDSPIEQAMQEWIESSGGNAFNELTLPKTALLLNQWVGRLIRSVSDTGRVVFLDPRMKTKGYGRQILAGLPDFAIAHTLASRQPQKRP